VNPDPWRLEPPTRVQLREQLTPPRLLAGSFLLLIAFGTVGLMTLPGLYEGPSLTWLDALFTATSAVCVTGLIVVDTATYFTPLGQAYLLLLIQLGGLGILTFTSFVILALARRLSLHHETLTAGTADVAEGVEFRHLLRNVLVFTFLFEVVGTVILFVSWLPRFSPGEALWHAVFQAVSAFCNAGFSTFSDSLTQFQTSPVSLTAVMGLIVLGGLGFLTLDELYLWWQRRGTDRRFRVSLHSRMVLTVTGILLVGGAVVYGVLEWTNALGEMPTWARALNAGFMSVTARTAGFNTVDYGATADSTNFVTMVLMSIGGSPGSTAGGIKTTTVAVIGLLAWSRLRGHQVTSAASRSIPEETIQRAVGLFVVAFGAVTVGILLYSISEIGAVAHPRASGDFVEHMFEAVSAFNTVGLSMGATEDLSGFGRMLTVGLMYLGRIGPLTFAAAIALDRPTLSGEFRYAYEDVIIG